MRSPLYPIKLKFEEARKLKWAEKPENKDFFNHLKNSALEFPSLIFGSSADKDCIDVSIIIADELLSIGLNVFLCPDPVPIVSLAQSIGVRNMPLGLYLRKSDDDLFELISVTNHGGPLDIKDVKAEMPKLVDRTGVIGHTEVNPIYVKSLKELADPFIGKGRGFSALESPFKKLNLELKKILELENLFEIDPEGPKVVISEDGQKIKVVKTDGSEVSPEEITYQIANYLHRERMASGTIVGPTGKVKGIPEGIGEILEIEGSCFDMNYHAGFADLLIGWWEDGTIAHQGSGCFGDAYLSAIYLLEAWRS